MRLAKKLVILSALLLLTQAAWAGVLSPGLETQIQGLRGDEEIKVLVVLQDQADIATLNQDLRASKATRATRHRTVLGVLQDTARRSQDALLRDLDARKSGGGIAGYTPHWLVNAVVVSGTVDAIRAIAARPEVAVVEPDLVVEPILPIEPEKPAARGDNRGIGITPGVVNIGARRVWDELGIDGTGVVVGILDTGVDGNHPALADRWRGLFADPSECWLDAANLGDPNFPADRHYHGTHVMGTVTGQAEDDTIGVAPGALWIATNCINMSTGPAFDNAVIASLEFMADPDGDPSTTDDVPVVVQNSWGVNENFSGYYDCDSRWWDAIDNAEAACVCLTWSAGNEGPGSTTLRSPADRADTPYNCFSVGSTIANPPFTISSFSSRGPSGCGGAFATKPEVSAPGSDIYSAQPGGGYQYLSGTSMAGPHVAGVVALMCSANPDLDVDTIKQVLMDTAVDLGTVGEDNTYGHGFIDAYEAVLAVLDGYGTVEGIVTDAGSGLPIEGAEITVVGRPTAATTDENGYFSFMLPADTFTLEYAAFGYEGGSQPVTVIDNDTVDASLALVQQPTAVLSGTVDAYTGDLVVGATVTVLDTPVPPAVTDVNGFYSLTLPAGNVYDVVARAVGFGADQQQVDLQGDTTLDFTLPELTAEDFESGNFLQYPWEMSGNQPWVVDSGNPYEGNFAARSGDIGDNQTSTLEVTLQITASDDIRFWYRVSSETSYDYLRFYVDGNEIQSWSGEIGWTQFSHPVAAGEHTFRWSYTKDGSVSNGSDAAWLDFIEFPPVGEIPQPELVIDVTSLDVTMNPGDTHDETMTLGNVGPGELDFQFLVQYDPQRLQAPEPATPAPHLPKGAEDTEFGTPPVLDQGGPDGFGYTWKDSNEPGGPAYDWVEINGIGDVVGTGDDSSFGPFPLGFNFSFYGQIYDEVRVCTNGFLSFTSSATDYSNDPIPSSAEPNALLAPFWDDLNPNSGGTIYWYADVAEQRFIVEWDGVHHYPSGDPETFQVHIYANGSIEYHYDTVANGTSCTVGIESPAGDDGLQVVYNASYLADGLAIRLALDPTQTWLTVTPGAGAVAPDGQVQIMAHFDATELPVGTYLANLLLATNDPASPQVAIPVTLTVGATAVGDRLPDVVQLHGAAPNPFNPMTTLSFSLPRTAHVDLRIYDVQGRLVKTLVDEVRPAGIGQVNWNGTDASGRGVASGTYFARLRTGGEQQVKSLVLVR